MKSKLFMCLLLLFITGASIFVWYLNQRIDSKLNTTISENGLTTKQNENMNKQDLIDYYGKIIKKENNIIILEICREVIKLGEGIEEPLFIEDDFANQQLKKGNIGEIIEIEITEDTFIISSSYVRPPSGVIEVLDASTLTEGKIIRVYTDNNNKEQKNAIQIIIED